MSSKWSSRPMAHPCGSSDCIALMPSNLFVHHFSLAFHKKHRLIHHRNTNTTTLVSVLSQLLLGFGVTRALVGFRKLPSCRLLSLVVRCALDLSSLLKSVYLVSIVQHICKSAPRHRTWQQHPGISTQPRDLVFLLCSIFVQASILGL